MGLTVSFLTLLIVSTACLCWLKLSGNRLLGVRTASMVPTFRTGDALIVRPADHSALKPGQVISYHDTRNPNVVISHRLIRIDHKTGWLTTAGDARHSVDPSFPPQLLIGQAILLLPGFGRVMNILRSPFGLGLAVYLPAVSVIVIEVRRLADVYARPLYSARL